MGLTQGTEIGPYRILSTLGSGGMGDVYRARDPRLERDVAIKALPDTLASDADRVARFEREAYVLALLNHPHIAAIYGLEETGTTRYLILELIEGDTLARLLESGPLAATDALTIARQIADALHAAHDKGIVHRDLKPANIALTPARRVKVLDFGLAKTLTPISSTAAPHQTVTSAGTELGVVLGTAARHEPRTGAWTPDRQTDGHLGVRLCALRDDDGTPRRSPETRPQIRLPAFSNASRTGGCCRQRLRHRIRWLLRRCLAKDPSQRLHDIGDAGIEIDEALHPANDAEPLASGRGRMRELIAWAAAAIGLIGLTTTLTLRPSGAGGPSPEEPRRYNTSIVLPGGAQLLGDAPPGRFALSPDGRRLALVASGPGGQSMLLRAAAR